MPGIKIAIWQLHFFFCHVSIDIDGFILKILQISELQSKQKRSGEILHSDNKVREVKRIANAKLKSCADIIQVYFFDYISGD